jgi:uroporphyrinogen-III synthase
LEGRGIVITRPAEQGAVLAQSIESYGARAILFPVIRILDVADPTRLNALIDRLETFHAAIFISPNAVNRALAAIRARRTLPPKLTMIAIGGGSARALRENGVGTVVLPRERYDSEALLELPELADVNGKSIVIFRGEGGRPLLGDTLAARGAQVEYAECYRRLKPSGNAARLTQAWSRDEIDAVVATSSEGLRNLNEMLDPSDRERLAKTPLFVPHTRIAATAHELGLGSVFVTAPGDDGITESLLRHFTAAADPVSSQSNAP